MHFRIRTPEFPIFDHFKPELQHFVFPSLAVNGWALFKHDLFIVAKRYPCLPNALTFSRTVVSPKDITTCTAAVSAECSSVSSVRVS